MIKKMDNISSNKALNFAFYLHTKKLLFGQFNTYACILMLLNKYFILHATKFLFLFSEFYFYCNDSRKQIRDSQKSEIDL